MVLCKRWSSVNSGAWLRRFDDTLEFLKPIFCVEQLQLNGSENNCTAKCDITVKSVYFEVWKFLVIWDWVSQPFRDKQIGFNSCECIKFLNITNFHSFHVSEKRILSCNDTSFFLHFFSFYNTTFLHSGYVIKPPQASSAIYGAPPFTWHP